MARVIIPDHDPITLPQEGLTIEEVRRGLVSLGYTSVETAQGSVDPDGTIRFQRAVGGEKGL
jgi:hypothetical protein